MKNEVFALLNPWEQTQMNKGIRRNRQDVKYFVASIFLLVREVVEILGIWFYRRWYGYIKYEYFTFMWIRKVTSADNKNLCQSESYNFLFMTPLYIYIIYFYSIRINRTDVTGKSKMKEDRYNIKRFQISNNHSECS